MTAAMREAAVLLPCPFCGGDELSHGWSSPGMDGSAHSGSVECHACDVLIVGANESEAIAAWNRRAPVPQAAEIERLRAEYDRGRVDGQREMRERAVGVASEIAISAAERRDTARTERDGQSALVHAAEAVGASSVARAIFTLPVPQADEPSDATRAACIAACDAAAARKQRAHDAALAADGLWPERVSLSAAEYVDVILSALPRDQIEADGWLPIETAPEKVEIDIWVEALDGDGWRKTGQIVSINPIQILDDNWHTYWPHENGGYATRWRYPPAPPTTGAGA